MDNGYRVTDADGREHTVSAAQLEQMYREGRVNRSSNVYDSFAGQWRKLEEVVDIGAWDQWRGQSVAPQSSSAPPPPTFMPTLMGVTTPATDEPRTSGMVAAAVLLFINAGLSILSIIVLASQDVRSPGGVVIAAPIWDIVVEIGLLRGKDAAKQWAMIRAVLGAAVFGAIFPAIQQTLPGLIEGVFQIIYSAGILVLLFGGVPSRERVVGGVITVIFAWLGVVGGGVAQVVMTNDRPENLAASSAEREIQRQAVPTSYWEDKEIGVTVNFPSGWSLLPPNNSIMPLPDARMIAINSRTGCLAVLLVEKMPVKIDSLNLYLDLLLESRQSQAPGTKDLGRLDVTLGNMNGRRMTVAWEQSGLKFIGYNSVCRIGSDYYLLSGWSVEEARSAAFISFQALEESFDITGPSATGGATEKRPPARKIK